MIKSKVFEILDGFSKDDFKKFYDFACSPFFNKKETLAKLTQVYKNQHPDFEDQRFTKEKVFQKLFPDKKYNDEVFRNLNSDLMRLAENFLSQINFHSESFLQRKHLISEITKRKLFPLFEKAFEDAKVEVENYKNRDLKYHHDMYELYLEKVNFNGFTLKFSKEDIDEAEKFLLKYFAIKILDIEQYILYECRLHGIDNKPILKKEFPEMLLKTIPKEISEMKQIKIYHYDLKLEQTNNERYYQKLKELLHEHGNLIEKENLYNKYIDLQNFLQRAKSSSDLRVIEELFKLRQIIVEKKIYPENFISYNLFINMVRNGIMLNKPDWVRNFIDNYSHIISSPYRKSTKEFSLALMDFANREYESSLMHLANVKYENRFFNLQIKNLTSRIFYEKNDFLSLTSTLNAYRSYLHSNKRLSEKEINDHNLFITNLATLIRVKEEKKYDRLESVEESTSTNDFPSKIWILEKIKVLNEKSLNTGKIKR